MNNRSIIIICRSRSITLDIKKTSLAGLLSWGSHLKHKYLTNHLSNRANTKAIKARIEANIQMPEWLGNHRYGIFDLLNYVANSNKYVYDPSTRSSFFDPIRIPSITSIHIYDYLLSRHYNPVNIDNIQDHYAKLQTSLKNTPLAVIISATFLGPTQIKKAISSVRTLNKHVPIIIGSGFLLSKLNQNQQLPSEYSNLISENVHLILEESGLDTLHLVLQAISTGNSLDNIPNIVTFKNGKVYYSTRQDVLYDINTSYPQWPRVRTISREVAFVRSSNGCPYKCKFCTFPKASLTFRQRSVESICDELKLIKASGINNVAFTDDHFAISPKRVMDVCKMMQQERLHFNWFAGIRASAITEETASILHDTGCKVLCVGLESGDDRILELIDKKTTASSNMRCLEILDKFNIVAYGSFLLGFPGETEETVNNTIRWINSSPLKLYKVFLFYLLPGAIIYDEQAEHDITFFGHEYNYCLWKTPTMDALRASELLKEFILKIDKAVLIYNYSPMYAFFPFLSKGFTIDQSLEFLRIRTELIKRELSNTGYFKKRKLRKARFRELHSLLHEIQP